jgi:hypothetical protein
MPINRIGFVHIAIADFILDHTPAQYVCVGYEVADTGPRIHIIPGDDTPPERWRTLAVSDNTLGLYVVDIAGRGSAVRDVIHLLTVVGVIKVSDFRPIRRRSRARRHFVHSDYMRITPFGAWLTRRRYALGFVLRAAVQFSKWRPWTMSASVTWRCLIRPGILALGALGGLDVIRNWFAAMVD